MKGLLLLIACIVLMSAVFALASRSALSQDGSAPIPPYFSDDLGEPGQNLPVSERIVDVISVLPDGRRFELVCGLSRHAVTGEPLSYGHLLLMHLHEPHRHRYLNGGANSASLVEGKAPSSGSWIKLSDSEIEGFFLLLQEGDSNKGYAVRILLQSEKIVIRLLDLSTSNFRRKVNDVSKYSELSLFRRSSSSWRVLLGSNSK